MKTSYCTWFLLIALCATLHTVKGIMNGEQGQSPTATKIGTSNFSPSTIEEMTDERPGSSSVLLQEEHTKQIFDFETLNKNQISDNLRIETRPSPTHEPQPSEVVYFVLTNDGHEDEYIRVNISDEKGYVKQTSPTQFSLPAGSKKEIPVRIDFPLINGTVAQQSSDAITIQARGKRNTITKRSIFFPGSDLEYGEQTAPFCYDRYVTGNCRYRTDPEYCLNYEWTAYAIVQNLRGFTTLQSIPEGLYVPSFVPGSRERVRVWVKTSCCTPYVQIISSDTFSSTNNICVVDVRELQWLHPGEIAGIVIAVVLLVIILIVVAVLLVRKRRAQTILVGHQTHHTRSRECISRE